MSLYRGFQRDAKAIAQEVRMELGLTPYDRLDPLALTTHLGIAVARLSDLRATAAWGVDYLLTEEPEAFSAVTVFCGSRRLIVHNDSHRLERQTSNMAHELGHALLGHPPTPALDDRACRLWHQDHEDEAAFLGGVLLIPDEAALLIARRQLSLESAAARWGVSVAMVQYRLNKSGAVMRAQRERRR